MNERNMRMGALPEDERLMLMTSEEPEAPVANKYKGTINQLTDEQLREMDSGSPFVMRADRLLKMGVPVDLVRIVDEHLGDTPFNSEEELRAIDQILNMYSHLLESGSAVPNEEMMRMESGSAVPIEEILKERSGAAVPPAEYEAYKRMYMEKAD